MNRINKVAVVSAFALISTAALAQGVRTEKNMSLALASEVIGAIGVGGAPGGHFDDQCAEAAIAKIKDRLN